MRAITAIAIALSSCLVACGKGGHDHAHHGTLTPPAPDAPTHPAGHADLAAHDHAPTGAHPGPSSQVHDHADHSRHHDHGAMLLTRPSSVVRLGLLDTPQVGLQTLRLQVLRPDGKPLTGMRRAPELQLVVYLVRADLTSFARFEALPSDGAFVIEPTLQAGRYHLYGTTDSEDYDFQLATTSFDLGPAPTSATPLPPFDARAIAGEVTATLTLSPQPLTAGDLNGELMFTTPSGAPLTDLDPMRDDYLDALIVGTDMTTLSIVHTHGRRPIAGQPSRPTIKFHTRVAAGTQRLFVVVQHRGQPLTLAWTLVVAPSSATPTNAP